MHAVTWIVLLSAVVYVVFMVAWLEEWGRTAITGAVTIVALIVLFVAGITSTIQFVESKGCHTKANDLGRDARYGMVAGCRVETDDNGFVPLANLRITHEEGE